MNAVIRAIVRKGIDHHGHSILGFRDGWRGAIEAHYDELTIESVRGILPRGGTILGSSRTNPLKRDGGVGELLAHFFDDKGRAVETALSERILALPRDQLKGRRIVAVDRRSLTGPGRAGEDRAT